MQQALTILISAQAGATIAFLAFALLFGGSGREDDLQGGAPSLERAE